MSKRKLPPIEKIIELYEKENKNCKEICRIFGLSPNSSGNIGNMLRARGIKTRKDAGKNHHNWKGGKISKGDGYIGIWYPEHERADSQGYVYEHTLVYQKNTGKLPQKGEVIHHIDLDKHNNKFENLYLCGYIEHTTLHRSIDKLMKILLQRKIIRFNNGKYELI